MTPPAHDGDATLVVRGIGELVTCDPERGDAPGVVRNGAVAARGERILFAGPEEELRHVGVAPGAVEIDVHGDAVIPGFVDSHTHLVWMGDRGDEYAARAAGRSYEEIAASGGGIRATVRATAAATHEALVVAAAARAQRMLAQGTTTVEVKSGYGLSHDAEERQMRAAATLGDDPTLPDTVVTYLPLHAAPEAPRDVFLDDVCHTGLSRALRYAQFADAFCEQSAYSVAECERFLRAAAAAGLGIKLHAEQRTRSGGALLAASLGAVSCDHLEHASDSDLRALADAGVTGVILPGAALVLGGPPPPGRRLLEAGATVAVATDCNPGTCWSESMPLMVSLAVALAGLTPAQALVAATHGGAAALRLPDRGVLRAGMRCDLAVLDTPHWIDIAYHLGGPVVRDTVLRGRVIAPYARSAAVTTSRSV